MSTWHMTKIRSNMCILSVRICPIRQSYSGRISKELVGVKCLLGAAFLDSMRTVSGGSKLAGTSSPSRFSVFVLAEIVFQHFEIVANISQVSFSKQIWISGFPWQNVSSGHTESELPAPWQCCQGGEMRGIFPHPAVPGTPTAQAPRQASGLPSLPAWPL